MCLLSRYSHNPRSTMTGCQQLGWRCVNLLDITKSSMYLVQKFAKKCNVEGIRGAVGQLWDGQTGTARNARY